MLDYLLPFIIGLMAAPVGGALLLAVLALFSARIRPHHQLSAARLRLRHAWLLAAWIGLSLGLLYLGMAIDEHTPFQFDRFAVGASGILSVLLALYLLFRRVDASQSAAPAAAGSHTNGMPWLPLHHSHDLGPDTDTNEVSDSLGDGFEGGGD